MERESLSQTSIEKINEIEDEIKGIQRNWGEHIQEAHGGNLKLAASCHTCIGFQAGIFVARARIANWKKR